MLVKTGDAEIIDVVAEGVKSDTKRKEVLSQALTDACNKKPSTAKDEEAEKDTEK